MSPNARTIETARNHLLAATALRDVTAREVEEAPGFPQVPETATDDEAEAIFGAQEDLRIAAGCYRLEDVVRTAETALIEAGQVWALAHAPGSREDLGVAFRAALGQGSPVGYVRARGRILDLLLRLDLATA